MDYPSFSYFKKLLSFTSVHLSCESQLIIVVLSCSMAICSQIYTYAKRPKRVLGPATNLSHARTQRFSPAPAPAPGSDFLRVCLCTRPAVIVLGNLLNNHFKLLAVFSQGLVLNLIRPIQAFGSKWRLFIVFLAGNFLGSFREAIKIVFLEVLREGVSQLRRRKNVVGLEMEFWKYFCKILLFNVFKQEKC